MKKVGIWSFSNHFKNKVFPSIKNNKKINITAILSNKPKDKHFNLRNVKWFKKKSKFFKDNKFDFVYISSINAYHFKNSKYALENNVNVICEKPICLNLKQLNELNEIAIKKKKKIFEMIQYINHPLFFKLEEIISKKIIGKIIKIKSSFKIPLNDKENFRYNKSLGGGALYDVGFYPISLLFTLFKSKKIEIIKSKLVKKKGLDLSGSLFLKNENNTNFFLYWAFNSKYENFVKIYGEKGLIKVKFIFSKSIEQNGKIEIFKKKKKIINVENANQINLTFIKQLFKIETFNKNLEISRRIVDIIEKIKKEN